MTYATPQVITLYIMFGNVSWIATLELQPHTFQVMALRLKSGGNSTLSLTISVTLTPLHESLHCISYLVNCHKQQLHTHFRSQHRDWSPWEFWHSSCFTTSTHWVQIITGPKSQGEHSHILLPQELNLTIQLTICHLKDWAILSHYATFFGGGGGGKTPPPPRGARETPSTGF